jgi:hypothetical protein
LVVGGAELISTFDNHHGALETKERTTETKTTHPAKFVVGCQQQRQWQWLCVIGFQ